MECPWWLSDPTEPCWSNGRMGVANWDVVSEQAERAGHSGAGMRGAELWEMMFRSRNMQIPGGEEAG